MSENIANETEKEGTKGRTLRLSESTYKEFLALDGTVEDVLSNLISTHKRTVLETNDEFGSQIKQVNSLTTRMGEIFESIIKQANTKSEIQESEKVKLEENYKDQLFESHTKIKELKDGLQLKVSDTKVITDELRVLQENYKQKNDQIIGLEKQIGDFDERIEELKVSSKEKDGKIAEKNEKLDELQKEIDSRNNLVSQNKELNDTVVSLGKEIEKLQEKHEKETEKIVSNNKKEIVELAFKHREALFDKGVELQDSFQVKLEKFQDEMNDRYEERLASIQEKFNHQLVESGSIIKQLQVENSELKLIAAINSEGKEDNETK